MRRSSVVASALLTLLACAGCESLDFPSQSNEVGGGGGGLGPLPNDDGPGSTDTGGTAGMGSSDATYDSTPEPDQTSNPFVPSEEVPPFQCANNSKPSEFQGTPSTFNGFASAQFTRNQVLGGQLPSKGTVREADFLAYWGAHDATGPAFIETTVTPDDSDGSAGTLHIRVGTGAPTTPESPATYVLVVDVSPSVALASSLELAALKKLAGTLQADDHVSLITYAGTASIDLDDKKPADLAQRLALNDGESALATRGGDDLESAIKQAANLLSEAESAADGTPSELHLIVLSDGATSPSTKTLSVLAGLSSAVRVTAVQLGKARSQPEENIFHSAFLETVASGERDNRLFLGSTHDVEESFGERFGELFLTDPTTSSVVALLPEGFTPLDPTSASDPSTTSVRGAALGFGRVYAFDQRVEICLASVMYANAPTSITPVVESWVLPDTTVNSSVAFASPFFKPLPGTQLDVAVLHAARFFRSQDEGDFSAARCALKMLTTCPEPGNGANPSRSTVCGPAADLATVLDAAWDLYAAGEPQPTCPN